jgi:hypothetical protein
LGTNAKLADIQQNTPPKASGGREIMRTHVFDPAAAQAGMMVVYGTATMQQQQYHPPQQPMMYQQQGYY